MSIIGLKTKHGVDFSGLVQAKDNMTLISQTQLNRLSKINNYDDTELRNLINNSQVNITQAVLTCEIPYDSVSQFYDVTIKLCPNIDMQTGLIQLNNRTHYQIMHIALDSEFIPLSDYYHEDQENSPKIPFSYFTGTLAIKLTAQNVQGFNPNTSYYAMAIWSNGDVASESKMIQFLYSGCCEMPQNVSADAGSDISTQI